MQNELIVETNDERVVLKHIPAKLDLSKLMTRLSFHVDITSHKEEITRMLEQAIMLARPEAIYKSSRVSDKTDNYLKIDGIRFNNPLLRVNLKQVERVFPYVITCGKETDSFKPSNNRSNLGDAKFVVREMVLAEAVNYLQNYITNRYCLDFLWSLQPGDMQAWPVTDRIPLFSMLGTVEESIGVRLSKNGSLNPKYSACGIFYDSQIELEGCQVCPQEPCMGRRAPYCEELARKYSHRARRPCGSRSWNTVQLVNR
jgi:hypothetical protein